jgi:hypothetical protein
VVEGESLVTFLFSTNVNQEKKLVNQTPNTNMSLRGITREYIYINQEDIIKVIAWEQDHPQKYAAYPNFLDVVHHLDRWELMAMQMNCFNEAMKDGMSPSEKLDKNVRDMIADEL